MNSPSNAYPIEIVKSNSKNESLSILEEINLINKTKDNRIKLRLKTNPSGKRTYYLEHNIDGKTTRKYLKLYYFGKSNTKKIDNRDLKKAKALRKKEESELNLILDVNAYELNNKADKLDFLSLINDFRKKERPFDKNWKHTIKHLIIFTNPKLKGQSFNELIKLSEAKKINRIMFSDVDAPFCKRFKKYLETELSQNTAHLYFAKLKTFLYRAVEDNIIVQNPAQFIKVKKEVVRRDFLTLEEIEKLKNTPCKSEETKRAFLFSCFSGLRISDIKNLTFNEIQNDALVFRQQKTKGHERLFLNPNALEIIELQRQDKNNQGNIFNLISDNHSGIQIKKWAVDAGINKNVTWHVGRHTFASLLINFDVDIYEVSKLLGHQDVKITQIYTKLIDKKLKKAVNKIPKI